jgi:hypothetical protein
MPTSSFQRVDHAGGNSALTYAFASLVTHSLFKTRISDLWINDASSYLDLSPLYGNSEFYYILPSARRKLTVP